MSKRLTAEQVADELDRRAEVESGDDGCWNVAVANGAASELIRDNLIETDEQRRERFERWCASNLRRPINSIRLQDGRYMDCVIQQWFEIWRAALTWHGEAEGGGE